MTNIPKTFYIYVLRDPSTNEVFYVGKTSDVWRRKREGWSDKVSRRLYSILLATGVDVIPEVIETVEAFCTDDWIKRENYWVIYYSSRGYLLNEVAVRGGLWQHSEETKQLLAKNSTGIVFTEERRRRIGIKSRGRNSWEYLSEVEKEVRKASLSKQQSERQKGVKFSEEHRKNLSLAHVGQQVSEERRCLASKVHKGREKNITERQNISQAQKARWKRFREERV